MIFDNLLRYAIRILSAYSGDIPLHSFLKNFFRENPQMGSRDRKQVSEMIYCFFRLGHSLKNVSTEERILCGVFLCNHKKEPILEHLRPEWNEQIEKPQEDKLDIVHTRLPDFDVLEIFPWKEELSIGIDHRAFCLSFLEKPLLFIRSRPGQEKSLESKLAAHKIPVCNADPDFLLPFKSYSFPGATKLDGVFLLNREAVVQDLGSQYTALILKRPGEKQSEVWDCCAGSGGKSILLADLYPGIRLTVSDIRESILKNCSARFKEGGIEPAHLFTADLTDQNNLPSESFHLIVADLPCTGSGTWSRSPEALYFFNPASISNYRQRQERILSNIIQHLKPGGTLVYITCSVFARENERMSEFVARSAGIKKEHQQMVIGYGMAADSMYASRFSKTW